MHFWIQSRVKLLINLKLVLAYWRHGKIIVILTGKRINDHGADYDMAYADDQHRIDEDLVNNSADHGRTQNPYYGVENEDESNVNRKVQAITIVNNMYYQ